MKKVTELKIQKVRAWIKDGLKPVILLRGDVEHIAVHSIKMHTASGACIVRSSHADQQNSSNVNSVWGYELVFDPEDILRVGVRTDGKFDDEEEN